MKHLIKLSDENNKMQLEDASKLISHDGLSKPDKTWIDLGCGRGLFTYALANILLEGGTIYAVDKSGERLSKLPNPGQINIIPLQLNFENDSLDFINLDGILMANSLHFVRDKISFINRINKSLAEDGYFLIVEYNTDVANSWVPYPCSFKTLSEIFSKAGYGSIVKVNEVPSIYGSGKIYSALIQR